MNNYLKHKNKALHERWVFKYLYSLNKSIDTVENDPVDYLSIKELKQLHQLKIIALIISGVYGVLGVVFLYLPRHLYPNLFIVNSFYVPIIGQFETSLSFTVYGFVLAVLEIGALTILHVNLVKKMADICNFPPLAYEFSVHIQALTEVSLEKPAKRILEFGIDPLAGLPKFGLLVFTSLYSLKATLSNLFVKYILGRILGRFYLRSYVDYVGIPIFAFWNIFATNKVINEAILRIMAPNIIGNIIKQLTPFKGDALFETALFDSLQFMAVAKRDFHHNHYLLINQVFDTFQLENDHHVVGADDFVDQLSTLSRDKSNLVIKLLVLGLIIDGSLSAREKQVINQLNKAKLLNSHWQVIHSWMSDFSRGKGLKVLMDANEI